MCLCINVFSSVSFSVFLFILLGEKKNILNGRGSEPSWDCSHYCSRGNHSISHRFRDHDGPSTYVVVPPSSGNGNCVMVTLLCYSYYGDNGGSGALEVVVSFPVKINGSLCCEIHMYTHTWTQTDMLKTCAILLTQLSYQEKTKISLCCLGPARGNQPLYCRLPSTIFRLVLPLDSHCSPGVRVLFSIWR